jgi:hypothetical protein
MKPSDDAAATEMAGATPAEIRKRMILISVLLGLMAASALILIVKAIVKRDFSLIAVVLPMFVIAIPMMGALVRLRRRISEPVKG